MDVLEREYRDEAENGNAPDSRYIENPRRIIDLTLARVQYRGCAVLRGLYK